MNVVIDKLLCDFESDQNLETVSQNELLENSDFISMHLPATKATRGMIDYKFLKNMKQDAVLINISDYDLQKDEAILKKLTKNPKFWMGIDG